MKSYGICKLLYSLAKRSDSFIFATVREACHPLKQKRTFARVIFGTPTERHRRSDKIAVSITIRTEPEKIEFIIAHRVREYRMFKQFGEFGFPNKDVNQLIGDGRFFSSTDRQIMTPQFFELTVRQDMPIVATLQVGRLSSKQISWCNPRIKTLL